MRARCRALLLALVVAAAGLPTAAPRVDAAAATDQPLLAVDGAPAFVTGLNYEGPADRAWQMWEDGKFDAGLIDADFGRAAAAGASTLRIFVQAALARDIGAGKWDKLDQVVGLAEAHNLRLIVSLHDYSERDVSRVAATAGQIADRYKGRPGVLAFDLKNEPHFSDLVLTRYPSPVPLQQRGLIDTFGERIAHDDLAAYRDSDEGHRSVPAWLPDDEAWVYANNLRLYREMLAQAADWVRANQYRGTTLDFLASPAGAGWAPVVAALNATLDAWLQPQVRSIRAADPGRLVTVDHVDAVLAKLPANDTLDVESLHRYPSPGAASIRATLNLLKSLQQAHPGKPYLLGEFGFATQDLDPDRAALDETAIWLGLLAQHAAGGSKWMLNDLPAGDNMHERTLGAYAADGSPKPVVAALAALRSYLNATSSPPGDVRLDDDATVGVRYVYRAGDAVFLGGQHVDVGVAGFDAGGPGQLFVSWTDPSSPRVWASAPMHAWIDAAQVLAGPAAGWRLAAVSNGAEQPGQSVARQGTLLQLDLQAGAYVLHQGA